MKFSKKIVVGLVAIVIAIVALVVVLTVHKPGYGAVSSGCQGSTTCVTDLYASGQFQIGVSGSALSGINFGTCYIKPWATTIAATTSVNVDCQGTAAVGSSTGLYLTSALSNVSYGDTIILQLATSTNNSSAFGGLVVSAVTASSTAGYIQLTLENLTGTTFTWPLTGVASGTAKYVDLH